MNFEAMAEAANEWFSKRLHAPLEMTAADIQALAHRLSASAGYRFGGMDPSRDAAKAEALKSAEFHWNRMRAANPQLGPYEPACNDCAMPTPAEKLVLGYPEGDMFTPSPAPWLLCALCMARWNAAAAERSRTRRLQDAHRLDP